MSDNFLFDVTSEGDVDRIRHLLEFIIPVAAPGKKVTHWVELDAPADPTREGRPGAWEAEHQPAVRGKRLVLLWHEERDAHPLPAPVGAAGAASIIHDWLVGVDYPVEPDHDGSNHRGWRIYNEAWGHVDGHDYAVLAVEPRWQMYGK